MALNALQQHLEESFHPAAAAAGWKLSSIDVAGDGLSFRVHDGRLDFSVDDAVEPDATFMFEDVDTAWSLLSGHGNAFEAFMAGRFRSDGYLMWAFALMAMFQSASLPETPTE